MRKPIIAIVGRPNVGKSTLFNRIIGKKIAVVEDIPGLTRDRLYGEAGWDGKYFLVVDTGGFQSIPIEYIVKEVKKQAIIAVEEADIVLMLMDAESGLMSSDIELSDTLRKYNKKIFYVVNKIDGTKKEKALYDFFSLGTDLFPVSALSGYGFDELMDSITAVIPVGTEDADVGFPKIAIVGRPNVGKSTFVNSLLGKERMIVSPVPGTTRDSIDSVCTYYGKKYLIVDTAGIRKKGKMAMTFERYSFIRTLKNIQNCDVALILIDAVDGVVEMDQKIAALVYEAGKGCIVLFNKWDLVDKSSLSMKEVESRIYRKFWFMQYAPVLTMSALSKQRITRIFPLIDSIISEASRKISTHELNNFLKKSLSIQQPPSYRGRQVKLSYITQIGIKPPSFIIFTNKSRLIKQGYIRFLERQLRKSFSFTGVPIRLYIRQKT
ncbi:MAG: ribosome biogenesis GTPase Der [Thermodesulfovibrionia bacterium]